MVQNNFNSTYVNSIISNYIKLENIKKFYCNELSLLSVNIRSLPGHFHEFLSYLKCFECLPTCIVITETFLTSVNCLLYDIEGYKAYHIVRPHDSARGGVSIYIRSFIDCTVESNVKMINSSIESLCVSFKLDNKRYNLLGLYRPPSGDAKLFLNHLSDILHNIKGCCMVAGDFNLNILNAHISNPPAQLINIFVANGYSLGVTKPTRPNPSDNQRSSLIDQIWFNGVINNCKSSIIDYLISDHHGIFFQLKIGSVIEKVTYKSKYRLTSCSESLSKFRISLSKIKWDDVLLNLSVDSAFTEFESIIYKLYNKYFPIKCKTISRRTDCAPWFDEEIKMAIKRKHILSNLLYKSKIISNSFYNDYCNSLKNLINKKRAVYFNKQINSSNSKNKWKHINRFINKPSKSSTDINHLSVDNEIFSVKQDISNILNQHFSTVGERINENIPSSQNNFKDYLNIPQQNSFVFFTITESEVISAIKKLKENKSTINEIPVSIFKNIHDIIAFPLSLLFNMSRNTGIYPESLKSSIVTPLFKGGNKDLVSNYRPISKLSTINKIFERIIQVRLNAYFDKFNLISKNQFGFCKGKSTIDALNIVLDSIYSALNENYYAIAIFLDFAKAFDCVDHSILLHKLEYYGIRGKSLALLRSYLSNRVQRVYVNGVMSDWKKVKFGVPQGSILGPLFFIVFINDMFSSNYLNITSYADDTTITAKARNIFELVLKANVNLKLLHDWICANKLSLNISKTKYTIYGNKHPLMCDISIDNSIIERSNCVKLLGIEIDNKLNFSKHISKVCSKLAFCNYAFSKIKGNSNIALYKLLYNSYAKSILEYGVSVWGSTAKVHLKPLTVLQNSIVRKICPPDLKLRTMAQYRKIGILPMNKLYKHNVACYMFRLQKLNVPSYLRDNLLIKKNFRHSYRYAHYLAKPKNKLQNCTKNIKWSGPNIWNSLPINLMKISPFSKFKTMLKNFLLYDDKN
jgi:hypothetical protein